ncbi:PAAR domain-containing protein [Caballeronia sp. BR00000012568055]|uniref:PAAR domain-containing protein n=1 Tax=Caballeronia sp. BR00000012568055 TaxID=2918761 RepID=UPI0023F833F5|nr:PAAR domain-containing protein [Caballeronia sp. BR00000012568055]
MTDRLVAKGDSTTTQGRVLGGSSSWYASNGQTLARRNDLATCGKCEGAFPILGTASTWLDGGLPTVKHLDRVLCPCGENRVLSGNWEFLFTGGGAPSSGAATTASFANTPPVASVFDEEYVLRDSKTGLRLANVFYRLTSTSGMIVEGMTDQSGKTQRIKTSAAQEIKVEIKEAE